MPLATVTTTTIEGIDYYVFDLAKLRIPVDWNPGSNIFLAVAVPDGGLANFPILAQGDPGGTPEIDEDVDFTPLAWNDATPDSASFTEISPNVYQLSLSLHTGEPGDDGVMELDVDAYGTPLAGKIIVVNEDADGFEYQTQKVGDRHYPGSYNSTPSGQSSYTLAIVSIAAQDNDWRPEPHGDCEVTGTGTDVQVNLVARLQVGGVDVETSGNIVGRGRGQAGQNPPPITLIPGLFPGTYPPATDFDLVPAGVAAVLYYRVERQSGSDTFTTSDTTTSFWVKVNPVP